MLHRLREAYGESRLPRMQGPVVVDERRFGGKHKNMHAAKRPNLSGRGSVGKRAVAGTMDRACNQVRARVIRQSDALTLHGFMVTYAAYGATAHTVEANASKGIPCPHEAVKHSVGEYVRDQTYTNGAEGCWALLKRGVEGTYLRMSPK